MSTSTFLYTALAAYRPFKKLLALSINLAYYQAHKTKRTVK
ncbi:hypothetical protein DB41_IB00120 [Neochlamydia sp. TUME1]|nr:hypothetical protein DB41_IB00120 [Neochlamydia sp. TUME1]